MSASFPVELPQSIITITTDFGEHFATGQMHGIAYQMNPQAKVISITDHVQSFSILEGSFCLLQTSSFYPQGSIHVAVIDPGVGSSRKCIVVKTKQGYFVGPDNGVFYPSIVKQGFEWAYAIEDEKFPERSNTFHGRDIFVRLAAMMTAGVDLAEYGEPVNQDQLVKLEYASGQIVHIDGFGNIKINHPALDVAVRTPVEISIGSKTITASYGKTLSDVKIGEWITYVGSHNILEIAINQGSAAPRLGAKLSDIVTFAPKA